MVEFGAGGTINQAVEGGAEGAGTANTADPSTGTPSAPLTPTTNQRRKRKAKGWFCPVCRQREYIFPSKSNKADSLRFY